MTTERTCGCVAHEEAVRKARSATTNVNGTTNTINKVYPVSENIDVHMRAQRTRDTVAGEGAVRKAWGAISDIDSTPRTTTISVYSIVSTRSSMST
jgi:hypothetical protein